ncbi:alpha/beta fold hydrolase [Streptacidiphilus sp. N1-10]|uniref:Alpha/beta fold hydrolase n=1 Tax=Streptacidiphilus jeojiensis TaxID=3229225 RepID=A0ABV6XN88_9ACTN
MTDAPVPQWLFPLRKQSPDAAAPQARLLVLPYAAAGAASLRPLVAALPAEIQVLGVSLPGRERRFSEPPVTGHTEIVTAVTRELAALPPLPTWLFGHSMGASLALACALAAPELCHGVAVSARKPTGVALESLRGLDDEQIVGFFGAVGNTAPKLLADPFWRARLIDLFRSDTRLDEEVSAAIEGAPLDLPVLALGGADDPYVPAAELYEWERRTSGGCEVQVLPGAHFYLLDPGNRAAVQQALDGALRRTAVPVG